MQKVKAELETNIKNEDETLEKIVEDDEEDERALEAESSKNKLKQKPGKSVKLVIFNFFLK